MVHVVVNGASCEVPPGTTVLAALKGAGVRVPALCHDERLRPSAGCRLCLVQLDGSAHPVPACATSVEDGMRIDTHTPDLEASRKTTLRMLAWRYPEEAFRRFPDKEFHYWIREYRLEGELSIEPPGTEREDVTHPYIAVDMARCIDCYRCVRICAEVQGQFVWQVTNRGFRTEVRPDGPDLRHSSCVGCGACVDTCPTAALLDKGVSVFGGPLGWTRTTCAYCGTGCEMEAGTRDGRIVAIRPVLDAPVSKGHLCVKGRYAFGFASADDRITEPMIRSESGWRRVTWNHAYAEIAHRLRDILERHGAESVGLLGSARATNEDNYVAQKFARAVVGTDNVDCCARVCHAPSAAALQRMLGAGLSTSSFDDIEAARTILVCGANPTENHPIVGARIRQAALKGAQLIVIDPRRIELADVAAHYLPIRPGTNLALLNAMARTIVTEGLCDREFMERRVDVAERFAQFIEAWTPERAAAICDVPASAIRDTARAYAMGPPAISFHGLGLTEHVQGTDGVMALINLALLTGNVGRPGAGINPLRGQNNVQGAAHMGCSPGLLAGSTPVAEGREAFERKWGGPLPATRGRHLLEMLDAAEAGDFKALWAIGYDVLLTNPCTERTARALRALELVVVQDMYLTETARQFGSIFLPACSTFEREGTFMNAERRVQRVRAVLRPAGSSKPDWQILCETARRLGARGFEYLSAAEIWDEVRELVPGARGITYDRLDAAGLQWPCPQEDHPGTPILHVGSFGKAPRAKLALVEHRGSPETTSADYPFLLNTGRSLYQFNAGTMTMRTPNAELRPADVLDIDPADAASHDLSDGEVVRVVSRYGSAVLPVHFNRGLRKGELFATFHTVSTFLNAVTGPHRDSAVGTPEYKLTAVRLERVAGPATPDSSP